MCMYERDDKILVPSFGSCTSSRLHSTVEKVRRPCIEHRTRVKRVDGKKKKKKVWEGGERRERWKLPLRNGKRFSDEARGAFEGRKHFPFLRCLSILLFILYMHPSCTLYILWYVRIICTIEEIFFSCK